MDIQCIHAHDQRVFNEILLEVEGEVLLLTPTDLVFPEAMEYKNAELNHTATVVCDMIKSNFSNQTTKVLLIGRGEIAKPIFNELHYNNGYCVTPYG